MWKSSYTVISPPTPLRNGQRTGTEPGDAILTKTTNKGSASLVKD